MLSSVRIVDHYSNYGKITILLLYVAADCSHWDLNGVVSPVQLSRKVVRLQVQAGHDRLGAGVGRRRQGTTSGRLVPLALLQLRALVPRGPAIERGLFAHAVATRAGADERERAERSGGGVRGTR